MRAGGGVNHRGSLSEFVLVKDNHLAGLGITEAVARARALWPGRTVEVECDRPAQVQEAIAAGATMVLLDNMTPDDGARLRRRWRAPPRPRASWSRCPAGSRSTTCAPTPTPAPISSRPASITQSAPALDLGFDLRPDAPAHEEA